jgi:hypothetical protein
MENLTASQVAEYIAGTQDAPRSKWDVMDILPLYEGESVIIGRYRVTVEDNPVTETNIIALFRVDGPSQA